MWIWRSRQSFVVRNETGPRYRYSHSGDGRTSGPLRTGKGIHREKAATDGAWRRKSWQRTVSRETGVHYETCECKQTFLFLLGWDPTKRTTSSKRPIWRGSNSCWRKRVLEAVPPFLILIDTIESLRGVATIPYRNNVKIARYQVQLIIKGYCTENIIFLKNKFKYLKRYRTKTPIFSK